jgi:hypothetical protein
MAFCNAVWPLDHQSFYRVNQAYIVLLHKKKDVVKVKDYQPTSLIHGLSKLIAKALSVRLAPHMHELDRPNQSTLIKGHAIHDNFRTVQATTKLLYCHTPVLGN